VVEQKGREGREVMDMAVALLDECSVSGDIHFRQTPRRKKTKKRMVGTTREGLYSGVRD
jgi:hypothetical protein